MIIRSQFIRSKLYYNTGISNQEFSKKAFEKKEKLDSYNKLKAEGCKTETILDVIKVSRSTIKRFKKAYKEMGLEGLEEKVKDPNMLELQIDLII